MASNGNEFSGLPMADLIGAPLSAACDAQLRLAQATADFINAVGFSPEPSADGAASGKLVPRQVDFAFWRPTSEGVAPGPGGDSIASVEKVAVSVPLLALVNVPSLAIKSIDIIFDMEVKASESSAESDDKSMALDGSVGGGWGALKADVKIAGSVATHRENTRSSDKSAKYHVEIKARDDGMPEGLCRVLDMLQTSIRPLSVSRPVRPDEAKLGGAPALAAGAERAAPSRRRERAEPTRRGERGSPQRDDPSDD